VSKPATQARTARARIKGAASNRPRTASQAPTGAMERARPRTRCDREVNRLVYEYPRTTSSATGERSRQSGLSMAAAPTRARAERETKSHTSRRESTPRGSSRWAVRGLRASMA
jgi:hypothetical protein